MKPLRGAVKKGQAMNAKRVTIPEMAALRDAATQQIDEAGGWWLALEGEGNPCGPVWSLMCIAPAAVTAAEQLAKALRIMILWAEDTLHDSVFGAERAVLDDLYPDWRKVL